MLWRMLQKLWSTLKMQCTVFYKNKANWIPKYYSRHSEIKKLLLYLVFAQFRILDWSLESTKNQSWNTNTKWRNYNSLTRIIQQLCKRGLYYIQWDMKPWVRSSPCYLMAFNTHNHKIDISKRYRRIRITWSVI